MDGLKMLTPAWDDYELLDSGTGEKLERFGNWITVRPEPQALWKKSLPESEWERMATAVFRHDGSGEDRGRWMLKPGMAEQWVVGYRHGDMSLRMRLGLTSFKHVGLFPEQGANWNFIYDRVRKLSAAGGERPRVLNLFAYTGGASLAARSAGAQVTHVDSIKQVITWARENSEISGLGDGIRWIVDDALKFARRELKRGVRYDGIILDPPAYGRGPDGERWVLEQNVAELLEICASLLNTDTGFLVFNLYSLGLSPVLARTLVRQLFASPSVEEFGELYFSDRSGKELPLGVFYRCGYGKK